LPISYKFVQEFPSGPVKREGVGAQLIKTVLPDHRSSIVHDGDGRDDGARSGTPRSRSIRSGPEHPAAAAGSRFGPRTTTIAQCSLDRVPRPAHTARTPLLVPPTLHSARPPSTSLVCSSSTPKLPLFSPSEFPRDPVNVLYQDGRLRAPTRLCRGDHRYLHGLRTTADSCLPQPRS